MNFYFLFIFSHREFYLLRTSYGRKRRLSIIYNYINMKNYLPTFSRTAYQDKVFNEFSKLGKQYVWRKEKKKTKIKMELIIIIIAFLFYLNNIFILGSVSNMLIYISHSIIQFLKLLMHIVWSNYYSILIVFLYFEYKIEWQILYDENIEILEETSKQLHWLNQFENQQHGIQLQYLKKWVIISFLNGYEVLSLLQLRQFPKSK